MTGQLSGKTAIVTGSTSGIGRATAILFAQEGANVVVCGRREELGKQVVAEIQDAGGSACYLRTDVGVVDDLRSLVDFAVDTYGQLGILVNNAISVRIGSVVDMPEEDWDTVYRTSLKAIFMGCKFAIPEMIKAGGGAIINMSSVHGLAASPGYAAYNTVKAGMLNLTRQMAIEYGPKGIRVNAICPGFIMTEMQESVLEDESSPFYPLFRYKMLTTPVLYPLGRAGRMDEVAQVCLFLASEASSFVTGIALPVDGGLVGQIQEDLVNPLASVFRRTFAEEWGIDLAEEDQAT